MQAPSSARPSSLNSDPPPTQPGPNSRHPDYVYQAAILVAVLLLLWSATV
jgi:hypothetical protein